MKPNEPLRVLDSRYQSLDLWRGVACLLVLVQHSADKAWARFESGAPLDSIFAWLVAATGRGWIGVSMFFVISGYCITASVEVAKRRGERGGGFFFRRFRRIYPPYWFLLAACGLLVIGLDAAIGAGWLPKGLHNRPSITQLTWSNWLGNLTLTETWLHHLLGSEANLYLEHAWTLCYEEQFYAVAGLLLLLAPRHYFLGAAAASLLTFAVLGLSPETKLKLNGFFFDGRWLMFAAGIGLYYRIHYSSVRRIGWWHAAALLGLGVFAWSLPVDAWNDRKSLLLEILAAFTFALLLSAIHPWDHALARVTALRPLMICGTWCYSLYLVHAPLVPVVNRLLSKLGFVGDAATIVVKIPICAATSLFVAWGYFRLVERRFLNSSRGPARSRELAPQSPRTPLPEVISPS